MSADWTSGLFGCFDDFTVCIFTFLAPCYTAGKNAESVGEDCLMYGLFALIPFAQCYFHHQVRIAIRNKRGIPEEEGVDLLLPILCCTGCAHCQEAREMNSLNSAMVQEQDIERQ